MAYEGPGRYQHYKGGFYGVLGLSLKEDTVQKPDEPPPVLKNAHVGNRIMFARCLLCGQEWVHTAMGIPPTMKTCGHDEEHIEYASFVREGVATELQCVVYRPFSAGSILEGREETFWLRERSDFDATVFVNGVQRPRFRKMDS